MDDVSSSTFRLAVASNLLGQFYWRSPVPFLTPWLVFILCEENAYAHQALSAMCIPVSYIHNMGERTGSLLAKWDLFSTFFG